RACLDKRPSPWGLDIQAWRELFGGLLSRAERVFAPSRDVLERFRRYLPDAPYQLFPHLEPRKACILVLGRLSRAKGLERLVACAEDAERRGLPLHFHVLGASLETPFWEEGLPLSFHGDYRDADLPVLVGLARPDAFLFPALGPETYSYTLSAAMETGLPIVAPPLGAFAERLSAYPGACLIEDPSPRKINDRLMEIAEGLKTDFAEPLEDYLAPVRKSHAPLSPWEPTSAHLYETPSLPSVTSLSRDALVELLRELMDKPPGVPIHEEDIRALKSRGEARIEALEKALEESQMRLSELSLEIGRLHEVLEDKEREKRAILASTSWRITAPLRWAILSWRRFRSCQTVKIGGRL
ncbi:MAG: glycosyltransferase, partial [Gammaproteobacteria bacterium]